LQSKSPDRNGLENSLPAREARAMLAPRAQKKYRFALRRGAASLHIPQVQVPLTLSRPAAGAGHGVDDAQASALLDSTN